MRYKVQKMLMLIGGTEFWTVIDSENDERISDHFDWFEAKKKADELNDPGTAIDGAEYQKEDR
jgi:hypothetical protein